MWFYRAIIATLLLSTASVDALERDEMGPTAESPELDGRELTQEEIDHWVAQKNDGEGDYDDDDIEDDYWKDDEGEDL
jgi:hypothetical protein